MKLTEQLFYSMLYVKCLIPTVFLPCCVHPRTFSRWHLLVFALFVCLLHCVPAFLFSPFYFFSLFYFHLCLFLFWLFSDLRKQVNTFSFALFSFFLDQQDMYTSFGFPDSRPVIIGLPIVFEMIFTPYNALFIFLIVQVGRRFEY